MSRIDEVEDEVHLFLGWLAEQGLEICVLDDAPSGQAAWYPVTDPLQGERDVVAEYRASLERRGTSGRDLGHEKHPPNFVKFYTGPDVDAVCRRCGARFHEGVDGVCPVRLLELFSGVFGRIKR